jgi:hypothetical protein
MTPKGRCKTWCGHTASWHYALRTGRTGAAVGTTSQSPPTRRRPTAGAKVPQHRLPRHS